MWFWLVTAIACVLFVTLVGVGIGILNLFSHMMDGF